MNYMERQIFFEDVSVGDLIPSREFGPLTIVDTVRWGYRRLEREDIHVRPPEPSRTDGNHRR